ncbi:MAG TPA: DUF1648 domain-containing protein [Burkholderiaceae bacterium]
MSEPRSARGPALALALLYAVYAGVSAYALMHLPEIVATHYNAAGVSDRWTTRAAHVAMMAVVALLLPLGTVGLMFKIRSFPDSLYNIPRPDYWLRPANRPALHAYFLRHGLWFACLAVAFVTVQLWLTVQANLTPGGRLPIAGTWGATAAFIGGTVGWIVSMLRHLRRGGT